jgi:hypothetical protein
MTQESQDLDPYDIVLADLKAQRDRIDQAIAAIESVRGTGAASRPVSAATPATSQPSVDEPGAFLGMTIPDAAKKLLASRRKTLGNAEIVAAFKAGGLAMNSVDPINTVGSVLTRRFNTIGDIVRVGRGTWGLAEWYPGRNFRKRPSKEADSDPVTIGGQPVSFGPKTDPNAFSSADPDPWGPIDGPVGQSEMEQ